MFSDGLRGETGYSNLVISCSFGQLSLRWACALEAIVVVNAMLDGSLRQAVRDKKVAGAGWYANMHVLTIHVSG